MNFKYIDCEMVKLEQETADVKLNAVLVVNPIMLVDAVAPDSIVKFDSP